MTAVAIDCVDMDVGSEGDGSRVGFASAAIEVGKTHSGFPFLHKCVGGVRSTRKELVNDRLAGIDMCGLKGYTL